MAILMGIIGGLVVVGLLILTLAWLSYREIDEDEQVRKDIENWRDGK